MSSSRGPLLFLGILIIVILLSSQFATTLPTQVNLNFTGGQVHVADLWQTWKMHWSDGHETTYSSGKVAISQTLPALAFVPIIPQYVLVATNVQYVTQLPSNPPVDYFLALNTNYFNFQFGTTDITPANYPTPLITFASNNTFGTVTYATVILLSGPIPSVPSGIRLPLVNATSNYAGAGSTFTLKVTVTEKWDVRKCAWQTTNCNPIGITTKSNLLSESVPTFAGAVTTTETAITGTQTVTSVQTTQTFPGTTYTVPVETTATATLTEAPLTVTTTLLGALGFNFSNWLTSSPYGLPNIIWILIAVGLGYEMLRRRI